MQVLHAAADEVKRLYTLPNNAYASMQEVEMLWEVALANFNEALDIDNDNNALEQCILSDPNWTLTVDERILLLKKAKRLGASSRAFLLDYHGYLAAHLEPGPEQTEASSMLETMLQV